MANRLTVETFVYEASEIAIRPPQDMPKFSQRLAEAVLACRKTPTKQYALAVCRFCQILCIDIADAMNAKQLKYSGDRGESWKEESIDWLCGRMVEELQEFLNILAIDSVCDNEELADIANFAYFIWWKLCTEHPEIA